MFTKARAQIPPQNVLLILWHSVDLFCIIVTLWSKYDGVNIGWSVQSTHMAKPVTIGSE